MCFVLLCFVLDFIYLHLCFPWFILIIYLPRDHHHHHQVLRYWKDHFKSLTNKLFLPSLLQWHCVHCIDSYPETAISKNCPSLNAFQNVTTDSMHSSCFNIADAYSLEHSGSLSSKTCHLLRFCPLDGCFSCPKWIIPSYVAAWHIEAHLLLQLCLKEWFHMSLCQLSAHVSKGDPTSSEVLRSSWHAVMLSCCRSSCRHVWIRMPGFVPSGPPHYWSSVVICCQDSCVSDSDRTSYEIEGHIQTDSHLVVKEGQKDYLSLEVNLIGVSQECWILSSLDICCPFLRSFASCMNGKKIKA